MDEIWNLIAFLLCMLGVFFIAALFFELFEKFLTPLEENEKQLQMKDGKTSALVMTINEFFQHNSLTRFLVKSLLVVGFFLSISALLIYILRLLTWLKSNEALFSLLGQFLVIMFISFMSYLDSVLP